MHYMNGKEATVGDKVVAVDEVGNAMAGTVVETVPGADSCNLAIVPEGTPFFYVSAGQSLLQADAQLIDKHAKPEPEKAQADEPAE